MNDADTRPAPIGAAPPAAGEVPETYDLMRELDLLEPGGLRLFHDDYDQLYLRGLGGNGNTPVGPLRVQRAFPVSEAGEFLALKNADGEELGIIRRLANQSPQFTVAHSNPHS